MSRFAIPARMKAAVMTELGKIELQEVDVPSPQPNEAIVKVMAVGICGSDIHYYVHGKIGPYVVDGPFILGHECAGIVVAVGDKVTKVKPGDRVAIEPGVACGMCVACRSGKYNLCPEVQFLATPPVQGSFVQYLAHREDFLYAIPDHLTYEQAALVEPMSVGIHAATRARLEPGQSVLIQGMGPVGQLAILAARMFGAAKIIVSDIEPARLRVAEKLGATHCINAKEENVVEAVKSYTNGAGVDVAFETAGHELTIQSSVYAVKRGGTISIVGLPPKHNIEMDIPYAVDNELNIFGVFRYRGTYERAITYLANNHTEINSIITDRYTLHKAWEAMERAHHNKTESLKVFVYPNSEQKLS